MDPNETLKRLREFVNATQDFAEICTDVEIEIGEYIKSLDDWISNGGFLPDDWSRSKDF